MRRLEPFHALARALAVAPDVLLLDEPLSALEPNFRQEIRGLLRRLHHETGITALMVTHDFADVQVAYSGILWQTLLPTSRLLDEAIAEGREVWLEVPAAARQPVRSTRVRFPGGRPAFA
jgi:ABC-type uncharacterized transport system ATPase subunit